MQMTIVQVTSRFLVIYSVNLSNDPCKGAVFGMVCFSQCRQVNPLGRTNASVTNGQ